MSWSRCCRGSSRCCCCRRGSSRCSGRGCRCWGWRRTWDAPRGLNDNTNWRASLKEAYGSVSKIWRLVGIKTEVIHSSKANGVGILIGRKSFRAPGDRAGVLGNIPRSAGITSVSLSAIMWPAGLLNRRMKSYVTNINSRSYRHAERLDGSIEVLVIERVLIVPDAS